MRKVSYCAAGVVVDFQIPTSCYEGYLRGQPLESGDDLQQACAVLRRATEARYEGAAFCAGPDEIDAACRIWHFFNSSGEYSDDIVVVDHVGDGLSVEFAPLPESVCSLATYSCRCRNAGQPLA